MSVIKQIYNAKDTCDRDTLEIQYSTLLVRSIATMAIAPDSVPCYITKLLIRVIRSSSSVFFEVYHR